VLQGEREFARDNRSLGRFHLDGIPSAPRGTPQIEVTFDIDANGILNVSAQDKGTDKEQSIRIESSSGLSSEEVDQMQKDAEQHAEEDQQRRALVDKRNEADQLVYQTEKTLTELGDKLEEGDRQPVEAALAQIKQVVEGASDGESAEGDFDEAALDAALEQLKTASHKMAEVMYQQQAPEGQGPGAPPQDGPADGDQPSQGGGDRSGEGAVDADFEVVSDDDDSAAEERK
jgi:molecular chaperone DnaK